MRDIKKKEKPSQKKNPFQSMNSNPFGMPLQQLSNPFEANHQNFVFPEDKMNRPQSYAHPQCPQNYAQPNYPMNFAQQQNYPQNPQQNYLQNPQQNYPQNPQQNLPMNYPQHFPISYQQGPPANYEY